MNRRMFLVSSLATSSLLNVPRAFGAQTPERSKNLALLGASSAQFLKPTAIKKGQPVPSDTVIFNRGNKNSIALTLPDVQGIRLLNSKREEFVIVQASRDQGGSQFTDP